MSGQPVDLLVLLAIGAVGFLMPLSVIVYLLIAALLLFPLVGKLRRRGSGEDDAPPPPLRERVGV